MSGDPQPARVRIVSSSLRELEGRETPLTEVSSIIGRSDTATIVLTDKKVSRKHARIERSGDEFRILDNDSANGIFVEEKQVEEALLMDGMSFRIGDHVMKFLAPRRAGDDPAEATMIGGLPSPVAAADQTMITAPPEFLVRVVESTSGVPAGKEFPVKSGFATLGRSDDCSITLADENASRRHARIEAMGHERYRLVDTNSANGLWVGDKRVSDEKLEAGQRFRIGETFFECHPIVVPTDQLEATGIMKGLGDLMGKVAAKAIEQAGELVEVTSARHVLLDDPEWAYLVVSGNVEVFTVTVRDGRPLGARNHFVTVKTGEALFGVDVGLSKDSAFLASGKAGTQVRKLPRSTLQELAAKESHVRELTVELVDGWVGKLSGRLTRDVFPRPPADIQIEAGTPATLPGGQRAKAQDGVAWFDPEAERTLFIGMTTLSPEDEGTLAPLTAQTWIELLDETDEPLQLAPKKTAEVLKSGQVWAGLDLFHQALSECEFINKRLAIVDEYQRLDRKAKHSEAARDAAYDAIGAVLAGKNPEPEDKAPAGRLGPVMEACQLVARAIGMSVKSPFESNVERSFDDHLGSIAVASRFRTRRVALRGAWWTGDQGPLLARLEEDGTAVALLPRGPRSYECVNPVAKTRETVTPALASTLAPFGHTFYRAFPPGPVSIGQLLRFGVFGLKKDLRLLIAMGILVGAMGAVGPYLTGRMIDGAIPQGDRNLLWQMGLGMLLAALATAAFKVTQSVSVVRVQGRMDYYLQAALWDRLLSLPTGFFSKYGAGDLAERAAGVNGIRDVISDAGVTGILGSLSSVAYVILMMTYSFKLGAVALAITMVLIGFTSVANYLQLRFQRKEMKQQGLIASLVLQLIAGVSKVRVCAAENHALRVWAQKYADQKRTGFSIGQIQNVVQTFAKGFEVLAQLGIFTAIYYIQTSAKPGTPPPLSTGDFVGFNAAFGSFVGAMQQLSQASLGLLETVPIFERFKPILTTEPESDESKAHPGKLRGAMGVSHLSFRYVTDGPWILKDISLSIEPGQFVAFVGGSGCGKSTLMRLLLGFEVPALGACYYDGQDLSTLDLRSVRQQLGVVLQASRVLPTDIFRNIVGTTSRTMDDAWEAAEMAGLGDDVRQMPMGMHTIVSEGGGTFSGGQRQRLLIARSLVNKPRIIFFDEATSALDNKSQALVTESMDRMDATRIVIAHRLSTIVNADRIFYLQGGEVAESGTYDELMAKDGLFAELAKRQIA